MKIEKEKHKVNIICIDGSLVNGLVHINPGERMIDFLNDRKKSFIAVTEAEFHEIGKKKNTIILNKSSIKLVEEV